MSNLPNFPILRPSLLLDFANSKQVDPRITFTRASTATYYDAQGVLRTAASGVPRIDHDPVTGECSGLLIEEARTNLLLNSTIDGANLVTQTVTVTAVAHTLSFYGTGTVTLSGAHVASAVGVGAYPSRTILVFTPTAGSLTLTVTGTVQFAQLEAGTFSTSHIPTSAAATTRASDAASMTGTNFSEWHRQDEGTFVATFSRAVAAPSTRSPTVFSAQGGTSSSNSMMLVGGYGNPLHQRFDVTNDGTSTAAPILTTSVAAGQLYSASAAYKTNDVAASWAGAAVVTDTSTPVPPVDNLTIGFHAPSSNHLNGHIRRIAFFPKRLANAELQALTA